MFRSIVVALLLGSSFAFGEPITGGARNCGTHISDAQIVVVEQDFEDQKVIGATDLSDDAVVQPINVYFHIITKDDTLAGGNIPDSQVEAQIQVLNEDYAQTGLQWVLAGTDRTNNPTWFDEAGRGRASQTAMKRALQKGAAGDLNIYTVGFQQNPGLLGYATFPWEYIENPQDDGVVVRYSTLPGGTARNFNSGHTLTHEVGHWVGLYHTFQGGCSGANDGVSDIPPEASPALGCPVGRDSCTGGGLDPVRNFMDYSYDSCTDYFSAGQIARLKAVLGIYRGLYF